MRDGMNLVAKEYLASRKDKKGVLILSEFAGAAAELTDAILVNPNDVQVMTDGIMNALSLNDEEQKRRMEAMQRIIKEDDIHKWTTSFIYDLTHVRNEELRTAHNDL
jgi:trehalose-6-phosphate synthase